MRVLLTMCDAQPVIVETVDKALDILEHIVPDLVISEIGMPHPDEFQLMQKVSKLRDNQNHPIPAIALTVHARQEDRSYALAIGFHKHIEKPFDFDYLIKEIVNLIDKKTLILEPDLLFNHAEYQLLDNENAC